MARVFVAVVTHEALERARDRWVVVISVLFALLAAAVSLYGKSAEAAAALTGPSLVTLASLFVPLVALILGHDAVVGERERNTLGLLLSLPISRPGLVIGKLLGRGLALSASVLLGLGAAIAVAEAGQRDTLAALIGPSLLLGGAFLSIGVGISALVRRQLSAASLAVVLWFLLVFFYDLGLLGIMIAADGALTQQTVASLVFGNPAGLYRVEMMTRFAGPDVLANLGMTVALPSLTLRAITWSAWIAVPTLLGGLVLARRQSLR